MFHVYLRDNMARLRLSAIGEGFEVIVSSRLTGADSPNKVLQSIQKIFPGFTFPLDTEPEFPSAQDSIMAASAIPLDLFLDLIHSQRILDTALDAMSRDLVDKHTIFNISRQAALAGKVSFVMPNEYPLGGVITIEIEGEGLDDWLEAATWHKGRDVIPRQIGDEFQMTNSGESVTWH